MGRLALSHHYPEAGFHEGTGDPGFDAPPPPANDDDDDEEAEVECHKSILMENVKPFELRCTKNVTLQNVKWKRGVL